ncbi:MAG: iron ABC transporter permease [Marinobacterium sp.]|nr:iron ABC transporter permease [Marinobacterium sp.]
MSAAIDLRSRRARLALTALALALLASLVLSVGVGPLAISWADSARGLLSSLGLTAENAVPGHMVVIIESIRLPRTLLAILVGASLAVCGAALQGLFRNPLADPGLIGVTGGAALAAVSVIVLGESLLLGFVELFRPYSLMLAAFAGGLATTLLVARIATSRFGTSVQMMLLAGIAVNVVTSAGLGVFSFIATDSQLRTLTFWTMGSLGGATWQTVLALLPVVALVLVWLPASAKSLNAMLLGESEARHLGVDVNRTKTKIIMIAALGVGGCVAVSGMIGFVGLVVPHLVRMTLGPDHRYLLPASALLGALFLLIADMFSRTLMAPAEIPIGLITAAIGGPFFIGLIVMRSRSLGG